MNGDTFTFVLDGNEVRAAPGETILTAADRAGIYIPRLCNKDGLEPYGACRVCTVLVNGRPQSACTQPATPGIVVESNTEKLRGVRKRIIEMLLVEGNHFCMFCEKSGNCELQALAYRFGILAPELPYQFPLRKLDATHPDVMIDRNRCVLCGRCVLASRDRDGKNVFGFVGRGASRSVAVNAAGPLSATELDATDYAADVCPVGSIVKKRLGYRIPMGRRKFDAHPIGTDVESRSRAPGSDGGARPALAVTATTPVTAQPSAAAPSTGRGVGRAASPKPKAKPEPKADAGAKAKTRGAAPKRAAVPKRAGPKVKSRAKPKGRSRTGPRAQRKNGPRGKGKGASR